DFASGALSQRLQSRKKIVLVFLALTVIFVGAFFTIAKSSLVTFYAVCGAIGFATGYWAVFVTIASEQFGTNIRATATTTVPNFVRGSVVPLTLLFRALAGRGLGVIGSAIGVGALTLLIAFFAVQGLEETYGKDLDFVED